MSVYVPTVHCLFWEGGDQGGAMIGTLYDETLLLSSDVIIRNNLLYLFSITVVHVCSVSSMIFFA